jgi:HSP20 family molecular chaperone IbpA
MWGKKCPNCAKKIQKDFIYCPNCAFPIKQNSEKENFGILGKDDSVSKIPMSPGLPLPGIDKLVHSLINQLGKELSNVNDMNNMSRNFKIQISTGLPIELSQAKKQKKPQKFKTNNSQIEIPIKEIERRKSLPRIEAESNVRRLSDRIVYEIKVPGVEDKDKVVITRLDNSYEIKAYSNNECYTKSIPINAEMIQSYLRGETLFLELKD